MAFCFQLIGQETPLPISHFPNKIYTTKEGLSKTICNKIFRDSRGFIWIATDEGINRFDGLHFENHLNNPSFPDDRIYDIQEYDNGDIWFSGFNGIYQLSMDTIINHFPITNDSIRPYDFCKNEKNEIYFINKNNPYELYKLTNGEIEFLELDKSLTTFYGELEYVKCQGMIISALQKEEGRFFVWIENGGKPQIIKPELNQQYKNAAMYVQDDKMFFLFGKEVYRFQNGELQLIQKLKEDVKVFAVFEDEIFASNFYNLKFINNSEVIDAGLAFSTVRDIIPDKQGICWVSTLSGLVKIKTKAFEIFPTERGVYEKIYSIVEDKDNNIWLGSNRHGLQMLSAGKQLKTILGYENLLPLKQKYFYPGAIQINDGNILFPVNDNIIQYSPNSKFTAFKNSPPGLAINDIKEDNDTLFLATKGFGIIPENEPLILYSDENGLAMESFYYIEEIERDKQNIWWLASHNGLSKFDGKDFKNLIKGKNFDKGINCIHKDYKDNLWFGSHNGLLINDYSTALPKEVLQNEINGSIQSINNLDSTFLVLGMLDKVILLDLLSYYKGEFVFYELDEENGFHGGECSPNCSYVDSKGNVWIGTESNLVKFIPSKLKLDSIPSSVILESYELSHPKNTKRSKQKINPKRDSIFLKSSENIKVNFYSINHTNPKKLQFQYWLKGHENDWSPLSSQRFANYSNLPIGKYSLEIRSSLNGNASKSIVVPIIVEATSIFQERWFLLLIISAVALLIIFLIYQRIIRDRKAIQLKNQLLEKEAEHLRIQQQLYLNQTDPHFTFNVLTSIRALIAEGELLNARRFIGMFGGLFRQMLVDDGKVTRTLHQELEFVKSYLELEMLRFSEKLSYSIKVEKETDLGVYIPKLFIQSFVNNAIKYAIEPNKNKNGKIEVFISQNKELINIVIEDNGKGIYSSTENSSKDYCGKGIKLVRSTIEWLNTEYPVSASMSISEITNKNEICVGTRIELLLYSKYRNI